MPAALSIRLACFASVAADWVWRATLWRRQRRCGWSARSVSCRARLANCVRAPVVEGVGDRATATLVVTHQLRTHLVGAQEQFGCTLRDASTELIEVDPWTAAGPLRLLVLRATVGLPPSDVRLLAGSDTGLVAGQPSCHKGGAVDALSPSDYWRRRSSCAAGCSEQSNELRVAVTWCSDREKHRPTMRASCASAASTKRPMPMSNDLAVANWRSCAQRIATTGREHVVVVDVARGRRQQTDRHRERGILRLVVYR